jgi:hypothetical protein
MNQVDMRSCFACLAAVEANMAELRGTESWWKMLSDLHRREWCDIEAMVRIYRHDLDRLLDDSD